MANPEKLKQMQAVLAKLRKQNTFSDVAITLDKRSQVLAHLPVLAVGFKGFLPDKTCSTIANSKKKKGTHKVAQFDPRNPNVTPETLELLLDYVYLGEVNFSALQPLQVFNLLVAADSYKELVGLQTNCKRHLHQSIDINNIFSLLKAAHEKKKDDIKQYGLDWAAANYSQFVGNREGVRLLGIELFQEVSIEITQISAAKKEPLAAPEEAPNTLLDHLHELHSKMPYADCTATVEGKQVQFHKALLGVQSEKVLQTLQGSAQAAQATSGDPQPNIRFVNEQQIVVENMSAEAFRSLLRYYYFGDADISTKAACQLVPLCKSFGLADLLNISEQKARTSFDESTVLQVLNLTYAANASKKEENVELRTNSISFILDNFKQVDLNPLAKMEAGKNISIDLLLAYQTRKQ